MVQEIVYTTKQAYYNTPIKFLAELHRNGWSVRTSEDDINVMVFFR